MIRQIVTYFNHTVPIIANGGIETIEDYYRCLEITGADGVMSAEGVLENPTLFAERSALYPGNAGPDGKYAAEELLIEYRRDICDQIGPAGVECEAAAGANSDGSVSTTSSTTASTTTFDLYKQVIIAEEYLRFCHSYDYQSITMVKSHLLKILYRYVSRHASIRDMIIKSYTLEAFGGVITVR
jgi:tRNA-dihydrouridine synthase